MRLLRKSLSFLFLLLLLSTALHAEFVASKKSNKYHRPTCVYAKKIKQENRVVFKDTKEAQAAGYVACKVFKP
jgi:methylphosphotriester-DNA--protein-cysteine methyltransferase